MKKNFKFINKMEKNLLNIIKDDLKNSKFPVSDDNVKLLIKKWSDYLKIN